jgi:hypothetical protein
VRPPRPLLAGPTLAALAVAALSVAGAAGTLLGPLATRAGAATTTTTAAGSAVQTRLLAAQTAAIAAAKSAGSVHYVQKASAGKQTVEIVGDASGSEGREMVTVHNGSSVGHVTGELTGGKVYFEGDDYGLTSYLGMPANLASKYAHRWIVFTQADQGFKQTAKTFTISGPLSVVTLSKGTLGPGPGSTIASTAVTSIRGRTAALSTSGKSGTGTLYVAAAGSPLPVRFVGTGTQDAGPAKGQVDFSQWGEPVTLSAPSHAVAASKI